MKAIVFDAYGPPDVLRLEEVGMPTPATGEVLVRVRAASVNPLDWRMMRGEPLLIRGMMGLRSPRWRRLGVDLAGVVEAVGAGVTRFRPGDEVFGTTERRGAFAEHACTFEKELAPKPAGLSFEAAASIPVAAFAALQPLRDQARVQPGQSVLVNGAAGGVGTFAVQIAQLLGADVTGVCSTRNVEMVRSLGASHVVDYTREDFSAGPARYDVIFDAIGDRPVSEYQRALAPRGTYLRVGVPGGRLVPITSMLAVAIAAPFARQKLVVALSKQSGEDLLVLKGWIEGGKVAPVMDRCHSLAEVPEAIRYLEQGHARGKVAISVQ